MGGDGGAGLAGSFGGRAGTDGAAGTAGAAQPGGGGGTGAQGVPGSTGDNNNQVTPVSANGGAASLTQPSGQGGDGGDGMAAGPVSFTGKAGTFDSLTARSVDGGTAGAGGSGGNAGLDGLAGGAGDKGGDTANGGRYKGSPATARPAGGQGGPGGDGGRGGDGAAARTVVLAVDGPGTLAITGETRLHAGKGGEGGAGGDSGHDGSATASPGGSGGAGGKGGAGGEIKADFRGGATVFGRKVSILSGTGGSGGLDGTHHSAGNAVVAGAGGKGGKGGEIAARFHGDVVLDGASLEIGSGSGGISVQNASAPGNGGDVSVMIDGNLAVRQDAALDFAKGAAGDAKAGALRFGVSGTLEVEKGKTATMAVTGTMAAATDDISFPTLLLQPGSEFRTGSSVHSSANPAGPASFYLVRSLDVVSGASWSTGGTFRPDSGRPGQADFMRFDLKDILPGAVVLSFKGSGGTADLSAFDPMAQHEAYLATGPRFANAPDYRAGNRPAFITSPYQTKPLDLGTVVLLDKTAGQAKAGTTIAGADGNRHYDSKGSAQGGLHDDFAFTAGLRRYYWDVFLDSGQAGTPLVARNHFTADATKVLAQGAGAALVAANQSLGSVLGAMDAAELEGTQGKIRVDAFVGGFSSRAKTGSHVDVDGLSAVLAVSRKTGGDLGQTTMGLFGEFGRGSYDAYSHVPWYGDVFGKGDVVTYGGGLFLRTLVPGGSFFEASARVGGIHNEFSLSRDPFVPNPGIHSYETDNSFHGVHLGVGHSLALGDLTSLVGYGRFFWTHVRGDSFTTAFGDKVDLAAVDSSRARLGTRLNHSLAGGSTRFFLGAAAEHEFDGKVAGRYAGDPMANPPRLRGTSGIGEMGLDVLPGADRNLSLGASVFGHVGRLRGLGGRVSLGYSF
jgi:hypothetical protein